MRQLRYCDDWIWITHSNDYDPSYTIHTWHSSIHWEETQWWMLFYIYRLPSACNITLAECDCGIWRAANIDNLCPQNRYSVWGERTEARDHINPNTRQMSRPSHGLASSALPSIFSLTADVILPLQLHPQNAPRYTPSIYCSSFFDGHGHRLIELGLAAAHVLRDWSLLHGI